ncbi:hypothetical protein SUGI_0293920 [Cryptomeria japonica]|uniref:laccase-12-like n=1 Tax=Cryptomeria japonica TaxID=3369 RepID=UPI002408EE10|nr:laccase-12-like [Cryptomeria japonica]GLJ16993.1 hypothetical protein SUGI_0293920 [Cryptomeria japonica]
MARSSCVVKLAATFVCLIMLKYTSAALVQRKFTIGTQNETRLCSTQTIVTVNGQFPGPTIEVHEGDNLVVEVHNNVSYDVTIHWHGVKQLKSCWADGPAYITQCPITPGNKFTYNFTITGQEGTLWWHAHITYLRATVHGALVIKPRPGNDYPFLPKPDAEFPIILGEWWNANVEEVLANATATGQRPAESDADTINSQPGDYYPCSKNDTSRISVESGKSYLLRIVNAGMLHASFFKIAEHNMTVVAMDAVYTKPYTTEVLLIQPGNTMDVLITADQQPGRYYIGTLVYESATIGVKLSQIPATAILEYKGSTNASEPLKPDFPAFDDTATAFKFSTALTSLTPSVPQSVDEEMFITEGFGLVDCTARSCPESGVRSVGSFNNISFVDPQISILEAYYNGTDGVFTRDFPSYPPQIFNYTGYVPPALRYPELGTKVKVLKFNSTVQVVFQNTNISAMINHPIHLHGHDFYLVGQGFGNYNPQTAKLNLENPQMLNTVGVPTGGWAAIRFVANNPGVWFVHCYFESHSAFGFAMAFLTEDGPADSDKLPPPPSDLPRCLR